MQLKHGRSMPIPFHVLGEEFRLYTLFRGLQGVALLMVFLRDGVGSMWVPTYQDVGIIVCALYVCLVMAMLGITFLRNIRTDYQFYAGGAIDIAFTYTVLYAAPGSVGMVALLMLSSVAASALFIHLRFGILMALLHVATLVIHRALGLSEHEGTGLAATTLSGFTVFYFSFALCFVAVLLGRIGGKLFKTSDIAREREEEITDLSAINEQMLKRLPVGVLVVEESGDIQAANQVAAELLQLSTEAIGRRSLPLAAPELQRRLQEWEKNPETERAPLSMGPEARQIEPQFLHLHPGSEEVLIFLEDTSQAAKRAEGITLAALGRFSASLAHEIRNPLSAIKYSSQLLGESSNLDVMDRRMLDIVQQQIQRMNGIIDSVLGLARRERAHPQAFDLVQMLRDFVAEYSAGFPLDNDTLELAVPPQPLVAFADPKHVHQILMVLISNARYYGRMPDAPAIMTLRLREEGGKRQIDVIDQGPGIAEQAQKSMFRPFYTTSSHGTGLGLYIARELARANEGDLTYLRRGTGSCFRLILPAPPPDL